MKILIIVFKGIGDVLLTTPLIRALKKNYNNPEIFFLTKKPSIKILKHNPHVSGVIIRGKNALSEIRSKNIDIAIDFMNSLVSGYYTLLSGAKKRIAFYRPHGFLFYNIMPERPSMGYTVSDRLKILEPLNVPPDGIHLDLFFSGQNQEKALRFLHTNNLNPEKDFLITLDITSPREHRMWPAEKFAEFADSLSQKYNAKIIFLWGPGEFEYVKEALKKCKERHFLCDDFDLLDLAALIKKCKLHIGTTSAPMHIAVSQNTPTFTIYCLKGAPSGWSPSDKIHGFAQGDLNALSVEEVIKKLQDHLLLIEKIAIDKLLCKVKNENNMITF